MAERMVTKLGIHVWFMGFEEFAGRKSTEYESRPIWKWSVIKVSRLMYRQDFISEHSDLTACYYCNLLPYTFSAVECCMVDLTCRHCHWKRLCNAPCPLKILLSWYQAIPSATVMFIVQCLHIYAREIDIEKAWNRRITLKVTKVIKMTLFDRSLYHFILVDRCNHVCLAHCLGLGRLLFQLLPASTSQQSFNVNATVKLYATYGF